jgi:hypothetical protein
MWQQSLALGLAALVIAGCKVRSARDETARTTSTVSGGELVSDSLTGAGGASGSKVENAMGAGPKSIATNATIMDWPDREGGQMKQIRAGSNGWVCFPSTQTDDAMCLDKTFQEWGAARAAKRDPNIKSVGVGYMLKGDVVGASNSDPFATSPGSVKDWVKAGPHVMVVVPDPATLASLPTDPNNGGPWVMWKGTKYAHIMVPVH